MVEPASVRLRMRQADRGRHQPALLWYVIHNSQTKTELCQGPAVSTSSDEATSKMRWSISRDVKASHNEMAWMSRTTGQQPPWSPQ